MIYKSQVFINNRTQNVRLPADIRYPNSVKKVMIRAKGNERIITPINNTWDSFFLSKNDVSDDFLSVRPDQNISKRESFDD